jgi:signal transduction histidine kinase
VRVIRLLRAPVTLDAGLALLLIGASLLVGQQVFFGSEYAEKAAGPFGTMDAFRQHLVWWWLAAVPAVVAILMRRRWPLAAFLIAAGSAFAHVLDVRLWLVGLPLMPIDLAVLITLGTLASAARYRRTGLIALTCAVAAHLLVLLVALDNTVVDGRSVAWMVAATRGGAFTPALNMTAPPALLLCVAWAVGDNIRTQRLRRAAAERHAADLQREQEQRAALAVAAERARITRELHDVVAHGMSVMVVQAQAAEAALRSEPDTAATALGHVIDTGRASLAEMRRLLGVVRRASDAGPQLAPLPGVSALPALIDQVRVAGTPVTLEVDGPPVPLPAAVDLSAYRIVQEALTNTRRHAGNGACATVRLAYGPTQLEIDVADDGKGGRTDRHRTDPHRGGNGLRGIAERVGALGGTVAAGPRAGGGFAVHAVLPMGVPA